MIKVPFLAWCATSVEQFWFFSLFQRQGFNAVLICWISEILVRNYFELNSYFLHIPTSIGETPLPAKAPSAKTCHAFQSTRARQPTANQVSVQRTCFDLHNSNFFKSFDNAHSNSSPSGLLKGNKRQYISSHIEREGDCSSQALEITRAPTDTLTPNAFRRDSAF